MHAGAVPERLPRSDRYPQPLPSRRVNGSRKLDHAGAADLAITIAPVSVQISPCRAAVSKGAACRQDARAARIGSPSAEACSESVPEFGAERPAVLDHDLMGRDRRRCFFDFPGKFRSGDRGYRPDYGGRRDGDHCGQNDELAHLVSPFIVMSCALHCHIAGAASVRCFTEADLFGAEGSPTARFPLALRRR